MHSVLLSLGVNLGDRFGMLHTVLQSLLDLGIVHELQSSGIYETEALGYTEQPHFLNCCIAARTSYNPQQLHTAIRELESDLGRLQRPQWHEREIDIDIILMDELIIRNEILEIPHPRMQDRRFVLQPAAELAPEMLHPTFLKTIEELLDECPDSSHLQLYADPPRLRDAGQLQQTEE